MAVPKKRTSHARRNELHMPHRVCPECGRYKGRTVVAVEAAE
jgi:ribosomal protein L32